MSNKHVYSYYYCMCCTLSLRLATMYIISCTPSALQTTQDKCFKGDIFPAIPFIPDAHAWHWHILGTPLSEGTECVFTTTVKDGYRRHLYSPTTACTIHSNTSLRHEVIVPAVCPDSDENGCSCHCREGFEYFDLVEDDSGIIFTCKSKIS